MPRRNLADQAPRKQSVYYVVRNRYAEPMYAERSMQNDISRTRVELDPLIYVQGKKKESNDHIPHLD